MCAAHHRLKVKPCLFTIVNKRDIDRRNRQKFVVVVMMWVEPTKKMYERSFGFGRGRRFIVAMARL